MYIEQEQEQERSPGYILPTPIQFIEASRVGIKNLTQKTHKSKHEKPT